MNAQRRISPRRHRGGSEWHAWRYYFFFLFLWGLILALLRLAVVQAAPELIEAGTTSALPSGPNLLSRFCSASSTLRMRA